MKFVDDDDDDDDDEMVLHAVSFTHSVWEKQKNCLTNTVKAKNTVSTDNGQRLTIKISRHMTPNGQIVIIYNYQGYNII